MIRMQNKYHTSQLPNAKSISKSTRICRELTKVSLGCPMIQPTKSSRYILMVCRHWGVQCWSYSALNHKIICKCRIHVKNEYHRDASGMMWGVLHLPVSATAVMIRAGIWMSM